MKNYRIYGTFLAAAALFLPVVAQAFSEETAALESIYERNARNVLNEILTPGSYNVVVSAAMREDEEILDQYRKEAEAGFLPGLIVSDDMAPMFSPANNKLHQLKTRVSITVLIDGSVGSDKEGVIRTLLSAKLHLNTDGDPATADTLVVTRSSLPSSRSPASVASLLPEFTWKMWVLAIILGFLTLVGIYLWALRRKALSEPEGLSMPTRPPEGADNEIVDEPSAREKVRWCKEQILALATQYPQLVSKAVADYYEKGGESDVVILFDQLGWDVARRAFPDLSPTLWAKMASMVKEGKEEADLAQSIKTLETMYHYILSRILERGFNKDDNNPFGFLFKVSSADRRFLLKGEAPSNLAVIGMFASSNQLVDLLDSLDANQQKNVLLEITRMQTLPDSQVQSAAKGLAAKLEAFRKSPQLEANGASIAADFLRALPAEREMELFDQMLRNSPQEADKIRRSRVQFMDLSLLPEELVSGGVEQLDTAVLANALRGADPALTDRLIALMPPKKAMMVQSDLQNASALVARSEVAMARRAVTAAVEQAIAEAKLTMADVWKRVEQGGSTKEMYPSDGPTRVGAA